MRVPLINRMIIRFEYTNAGMSFPLPPGLLSFFDLYLPAQAAKLCCVKGETCRLEGKNGQVQLRRALSLSLFPKMSSSVGLQFSSFLSLGFLPTAR